MNFKEIIDRFFPQENEEAEETELSLDLSQTEETLENGVFLNSVEQLTEEDIDAPAEAVSKKGSDPVEIIRKFFVLAFSAVFLISCGMLVKSVLTKYKAAQIYNQLEAEFFGAGFNFDINNIEIEDDSAISRLSADGGSAALKTWADVLAGAGSEPEDVGTKKEYNEELEKMRAGLASLARINPDIYGWITVEGTQINYPLVQGVDNDYYLDHAYTGDFLPEGSIFVDYRNNESIADNYNTVFYGHNLTSGGMFHDVTKFARDEYMSGKLIYVYTYDGVFIYEPFSFYESRFDYNYFKTGFKSEGEFIAFAEEVQGNTASLKKNLSFTGEDRLLTLSTCTNGYYTQRYAMHARLIDSITD